MDERRMATPAVAFINNFPGRTVGGGEVQLISLVSGLVRRGVRVAVFCAVGSRLAEVLAELGTVEVYPVDFKVGSPTALVAQVTEHIEGFEIVVGTGFFTNVLARQVRVARPRLRVVNVVHVVPGASRLDGESARSRIARAVLDRTGRRKVDLFVAVSKAVADALVSTGIDRRKVVVVENGIDVPAIRARALATFVLDVPPGPVVGFVGRLERVKGCDLFLEAASMVAAARPDVSFIVAGTGSQVDALQGSALHLGLADSLTFLGYVDDAAGLMSRLDVLVVPSRSEASGLVAMEGMAIGIPVVASRVGGLVDVIDDGVDGLLVEPEDAYALAGAVLRLLDDTRLADKVADSARASAERRFTADAMVDAYLGLFSKIGAGDGSQ